MEAVGIFGIIFVIFSFIVVIVPILVPIIIVIIVVRLSTKGKLKFDALDGGLQAKINAAPKANWRYLKRKCDGCGAAIDDDTKIAPTGETTCAYCGNIFNVVRTADLPDHDPADGPLPLN